MRTKGEEIMAYTTAHNFLTMKFRDIRDDLRNRTIELGGLVVVTDDDAKEWDDVSKSVVRGYFNKNQQVVLNRNYIYLTNFFISEVLFYYTETVFQKEINC